MRGVTSILAAGMVVILAAAIVPPAHAQGVLLLDPHFSFRTESEWDCSSGTCKWVREVSLLNLTLTVGPGVEDQPVKRAVFDTNGALMEEETLFTITSGSPAPGGGCTWINYCSDPSPTVSCYAQGYCQAYASCPDGYQALVSGYCQTVDINGPGGPDPCTYYLCGCVLQINGDPCFGHRGSAGGGTVWDGWSADSAADSQFIAPCGADTPITTSGGCEDDEDPCVLCHTPQDNGGPI